MMTGCRSPSHRVITTSTYPTFNPALHHQPYELALSTLDGLRSSIGCLSTITQRVGRLSVYPAHGTDPRIAERSSLYRGLSRQLPLVTAIRNSISTWSLITRSPSPVKKLPDPYLIPYFVRSNAALPTYRPASLLTLKVMG